MPETPRELIGRVLNPPTPSPDAIPAPLSALAAEPVSVLIGRVISAPGAPQRPAPVVPGIVAVPVDTEAPAPQGPAR